MGTASNVLVGSTGDVRVAPLGTTLPTNTTATPDLAFDVLGYISEDGVVESQPNSTNRIRAWQNGDTVRVVQTEHSVTFKFTAIETNAAVLEAFYGNYDAGAVEITGDVLDHKAWVFDVLDGDNVVRVVVPDGQVVTRGDVSYLNGDAVGYGFTVEAFPDENGVKAYKYFATLELGEGS